MVIELAFAFGGGKGGGTQSNLPKCKKLDDVCQNLGIAKVNLRYNLESSASEWDIIELGYHYIYEKTGAIDQLMYILPPDSTGFSMYTTDENKAGISITQQFDKCSGGLSKRYYTNVEVIGNVLHDLPVAQGNLYNVSAKINTIRTNNNHIQIVWNIELDESDLENIGCLIMDGMGDVSKDGFTKCTDLELDLLGVVTKSDSVNDGIYGRGGNDSSSGSGHRDGSGLTYCFDTDDFDCEPTRPYDDPFTETAQEMEINILENSNLYLCDEMVAAVEKQSVEVIPVKGKTQFPQALNKKVYSNGKYTTTLEWDCPNVYVLKIKN